MQFVGLNQFAMMFAAGMGIGLMFFGVAEPVMHVAAGSSSTISLVRTATSWSMAWSERSICRKARARSRFRPVRSEHPPLRPVAGMAGMGECVSAFLDSVASGEPSTVPVNDTVKLQRLRSPQKRQKILEAGSALSTAEVDPTGKEVA